MADTFHVLLAFPSGACVIFGPMGCEEACQAFKLYDTTPLNVPVKIYVCNGEINLKPSPVEAVDAASIN